ncbi:hypothetical protein [Pantoea sp. 1.19]|uniref:hypothetical protein n=1 Tax=Pantoea sp. 1.19 TaxID=1925589 RepID=UPI000948989B|nr:hypothetical protein [Pantoea sp. 1.19]
MEKDLLLIARKVSVWGLSALFIAAMAGVIFLDVRWMRDTISEYSLTEITQELLLLVIVLLWFNDARRYPARRELGLLLGGLFLCMLIRELDFLFDTLRHGAWFWFALLASLVCIAGAARAPHRAVHALADFLRHPCWGMMAAGLLTVLVFSRLYGMGALWQQMLGEHFIRTVKNMAEEGCELLGYSLCMLATLHWTYAVKQDNKQAQLAD